jgi:predicted metal-dependent hydrolase
MNTAMHEQIDINWGERHIVAELRRTPRRVLKVDVKPSGDVVIFAPAGEDVEAVHSRVKRKFPWIFRELDRIENRPVVTPARHFVSGETHLLLGKPYRLTLEQAGEPDVRVEGTRLRILAPNVNDGAECQCLLMAFYALTAKSVFRERLEAMAPPFVRKGLELPGLIIRPMLKRWGSYTAAGRIALNIDLVRASPMLIDYVICHELAHGFHADHGKEWRDLLYTVMPDWESRKASLEAFLR